MGDTGSLMMVGSALGSGPFGEFVAIEWLQVVGSAPIVLSAVLLLYAMLKHLLGLIDGGDVADVGYMMMLASGFGAIVYIIGFACIYTGLMWEGLFPERLPQNLLGSGLFFMMGLFIDLLPGILNRIDIGRARKHPRV